MSSGGSRQARVRLDRTVGVQVIGPAYDDDTAITLVELLADLVGGFEPPPDLAVGQRVARASR